MHFFALVTGGTSGIGLSCVELLVSGSPLPITVFFTGRRRELGEELSLSLSRPEEAKLAVFLECDHTSAAACEAVAEEVGRRSGGVLHLLVNNAGVVTSGTVEETSEELMRETFELNVFAVSRMIRLLAPLLKRAAAAPAPVRPLPFLSASIVNVASDWGVVGAESAMAYSASKGAVVMMTKSVSLDLARYGVRCNAVCPGDTFVERWVERGDFGHGLTPQQLEDEKVKASGHLPLKRFGSTDEIAHAVLFLAQNTFTTGTALVVDGGNTAGDPLSKYNYNYSA
jgi:NAD(P)-dependent dehydrogenase (short-subunit alcohol dehydrogenase family)